MPFEGTLFLYVMAYLHNILGLKLSNNLTPLWKIAKVISLVCVIIVCLRGGVCPASCYVSSVVSSVLEPKGETILLDEFHSFYGHPCNVWEEVFFYWSVAENLNVTYIGFTGGILNLQRCYRNLSRSRDDLFVPSLGDIFLNY